MIDLVNLRRDFHKNPETGFQVNRTSQIIATILSDNGLKVTEGVGKTGVIATLTGKDPNESIMLRADLDALPITEKNTFDYKSTNKNKFHGCGHDGHAVMLLGAALELNKSRQMNKTVHFLFQPNEENGLGALAMINDGLFQRFPTKAIYGLHNMPQMQIGHFATQNGLFCAFEDNFKIKIDGFGGHSSTPEVGIDPILAGSILISKLQTIISQSISPKIHATLVVTNFETDGARNVIASSAIITGDCRGYESQTSKILEKKIKQIAKGVKIASGTKISVSYKRSFPTLSNDEICTNFATKAAKKVGMVNETYGRGGFSEDFAHFLKVCPGSFILMGNGIQGPNGKPLHNPNYDFNDKAIKYGVEYWKSLVKQNG